MDRGNEKHESDGLLYEKMRKFISIIDELRDFGLQSYISLPRIVVVGLQSAGKSSLLESIVGYDFLPRGEGIVTRRPLELRLVHSIGVDEPYGIFEKYNKEKITSFESIRNKIIEYTDKDAGTTKNIINDAIVLTIYSKNCPDLSLVDLPGITKIPVKGSGQPENIEEITTELVVSYIKDPRTIILCTVQANIDISTSDAIKIAQRFDKAGERTICALTKVDLSDVGSNIRTILNNEEVVLKYGYVAVKNRSAQDIKDNLSVAKGLVKEEQYFKEKYPDLLDSGLAGTKNLVNRLSMILSKNIQASLPEIIKELREKIDSMEQEMRTLGTPLPEYESDKVQLIMNMVTEFCLGYTNSIKGKYSKIKKGNDKEPIGVEIRRLLLDIFRDYETAKLDDLLTDKLIKATFVNYGASGLPGFPPFSAFQKLLRPLLQNLVPRSSELVDRVYYLLEQAIQELVDKIFFRFPELKSTITDYALRNLVRCRNTAEQMVNNLMEAELGYLYTSDEEYLSIHGSILPPQNPKNREESMGDAFVRETRERVKDYFYLVFRSLRDSIPKAIGQIMLNESFQKMQVELFEGINKESEVIAKTLAEPDHILFQRKQCASALRVLRSCLKKLQEEDLIDDDY
jgi:GTPase SAR1 family protein